MRRALPWLALGAAVPLGLLAADAALDAHIQRVAEARFGPDPCWWAPEARWPVDRYNPLVRVPHVASDSPLHALARRAWTDEDTQGGVALHFGVFHGGRMHGFSYLRLDFFPLPPHVFVPGAEGWAEGCSR